MQAFKPMVYLNRIQTVEAPFRLDQKDAIAWLMKALERSAIDAEKSVPATARALHLYERFLGNSSIRSRRSVLPDFLHSDWESMELFKADTRYDGSASSWPSPPLEKRMQIFARNALTMAQTAFQEVTEAPSTVIEVSCTGYDAPYTAQKLLLEKGWQSSTQLLKLGHMGCYASVPALNLAVNLVKARRDLSTVTIFSSELCSLHLRPTATDADQIVANILFADGAARMDVSQNPSANSLALLDHAETILPNSAECMTWTLCDSSFHMTLSKKVGTKIGEVLKEEVGKFLERNDLKLQDIGRFAVHPGGPLIIETVQRALNLEEDAVRHSKAILREYGNMSSSTLPFIWQSMQKDPEVKAGEWIVSLAFGPGLTLMINLLAKGL